MMKNQLGIALRYSAVTLVLTGFLYPLAVTGAARLLFPWSAGGRMVRASDGRVVGSALIGQSFVSPKYFHPRPSACGYDALASGGSNLGPTSGKLMERIKAETERLTQENPDAAEPVPSMLVTASASGLDPHIPPEAALWQVPRVARARGVSEDRVRAIIDDLTEGRGWGFLGEPRINVLLLNKSLDEYFGTTPEMEE
jgi:K+-transporting ATPase ATPase C chain